ncbi:MAG TPA: hypothetical protein VNC78_09985 [Actinomycetota bacterium]|nr:hypothetical protein [Actinomycetota bacterium]
MRRLIAIVISVTALVGAGIATSPSVSAAATVVADYRFVDTLTSTVAGAPALEVVGSGTGFGTQTIDNTSDRVFTWPAGSGLRLPGAASLVGDSYTIVLMVRSAYVPTEPGRYAKIVDWHDGRSWNGLYYEYRCYECTDGVRPMFPYIAGGAYVPVDTWTQLTIVRYASPAESPDGNQLKTYLDGNLSTVVDNDSDGAGNECQARVGGCDGSLGDAIRFFLPNGSSPGEPVQQAAGAVARIRIFNDPLAADEVRALDRAGDTDGQMTTPSPTPTSASPSPTPSPTNTPPVRQCNDGRDNDGDGKTDLADGGCTRGLDNDERNIIKVRTALTIDRNTATDHFFGSVKSKVAECRKRKVILIYLDGPESEGSDTTGRDGAYSIYKKSFGEGIYRTVVQEKKIKTSRSITVCKEASSRYYDITAEG